MLHGGVVQLKITPALTVRKGSIHFKPRFDGPLGSLLNTFLGFTTICTCLLYLALFRGSDVPSPHEQRIKNIGSATAISPASKGANMKQLSFIEVQMLAKALGGSFATQFS